MKDLDLCSEIWQKKSEYRQIGPKTIGPSCPEGPQGRELGPGPNLPSTSSNRTKGLEAKKEAKTKNYQLPVLDALS